MLGTLAKLGLNEKNCSKFQTGGPDGDLGSNEIKISEDKTVGIVDGTISSPSPTNFFFFMFFFSSLLFWFYVNVPLLIAFLLSFRQRSLVRPQWS